MKVIRCHFIVAAAFGLLTGAAGAPGKLAFRADLDGYQEVSALSTTGTGSFELGLDAQDEASYELSYQGLEGGAVLFAHIHLGERHTNGGVIVFLCSSFGPAPSGTPSCPPNDGTVVSGTLMAADVIGPAGQGIAAGEFAEFVEALRAGAGYVNVHTAGFGTGEIRGQVQ